MVNKKGSEKSTEDEDKVERKISPSWPSNMLSGDLDLRKPQWNLNIKTLGPLLGAQHIHTLPFWSTSPRAFVSVLSWLLKHSHSLLHNFLHNLGIDNNLYSYLPSSCPLVLFFLKKKACRYLHLENFCANQDRKIDNNNNKLEAVTNIFRFYL